MAVRAGRELEPSFRDALAGPAGMADPSYPSLLSARVFPDALSAAPLGGMPLSPPQGSLPPRSLPPRSLPTVPAGSSAVSRVVARPVTAPLAPVRQAPVRQAPVRQAPVRQAPPQRPWSQFPPPGAPVAGLPGPPRPMPVGPAPGQPAQQYVPVPTSAQLAPGGQIRPPAYLPARPGLAQMRSAVAQARANSARPPRSARPTKKKNSGAWGFVVFVVILLVTTGAGQKIISVISDLLQRK